MVGVAGKSSFRSKRKQHLRAKLAQVPGQIANDFVRILTMKLAVGIVKHNSAIHFQNRARGSEFLATNGREFLIVLCPAAIAGGLSRRETYDASLHLTFAIQPQRTAEAAGFIVRMSRDDHQPQRHAAIVMEEPSRMVFLLCPL